MPSAVKYKLPSQILEKPGCCYLGAILSKQWFFFLIFKMFVLLYLGCVQCVSCEWKVGC